MPSPGLISLSYRVPRANPQGPWRASCASGVTGGLRLQPGAFGDAWHWVVVLGVTWHLAGLGCKRKGVWLRHSSSQRFRFLGFRCAQPSGLCWGGDVGAGVGMRVLGAATSQGSWLCVLLEIFVAQGEHPLHRESVGKVPRCHCSHMAAGSFESLPGQEGSNPAGPPAFLLPPYILRAAQRQRSRDRGQQPSLCPGRGLGAATSSPAATSLRRAVPSGDTLLPRSKPCSWDFTGRDQQRFPGTEPKRSRVTAELICSPSPPALRSAGDGSGRGAAVVGQASQAQHAG